jgi:integrase/recombinase XerD
MNHCSPGSKTAHTSILLSKAIDGFLTFKVAEGLSKRTIQTYEHTLRHWYDQVGDLKVSQIKTSDLTAFLAWMRTDYQPKRWNGNIEPLSSFQVNGKICCTILSIQKDTERTASTIWPKF